eukprot:Platyproteum_vivax@DN7338_c0_g1_i1.p1
MPPKGSKHKQKPAVHVDYSIPYYHPHLDSDEEMCSNQKKRYALGEKMAINPKTREYIPEVINDWDKGRKGVDEFCVYWQFFSSSQQTWETRDKLGDTYSDDCEVYSKCYAQWKKLQRIYPDTKKSKSPKKRLRPMTPNMLPTASPSSSDKEEPTVEIEKIREKKKAKREAPPEKESKPEVSAKETRKEEQEPKHPIKTKSKSLHSPIPKKSKKGDGHGKKSEWQLQLEMMQLEKEKEREKEREEFLKSNNRENSSTSQEEHLQEDSDGKPQLDTEDKAKKDRAERSPEAIDETVAVSAVSANGTVQLNQRVKMSENGKFVILKDRRPIIDQIRKKKPPMRVKKSKTSDSAYCFCMKLTGYRKGYKCAYGEIVELLAAADPDNKLREEAKNIVDCVSSWECKRCRRLMCPHCYVGWWATLPYIMVSLIPQNKDYENGHVFENLKHLLPVNIYQDYIPEFESRNKAAVLSKLQAKIIDFSQRIQCVDCRCKGENPFHGVSKLQQIVQFMPTPTRKLSQRHTLQLFNKQDKQMVLDYHLSFQARCYLLAFDDDNYTNFPEEFKFEVLETKKGTTRKGRMPNKGTFVTPIEIPLDWLHPVEKVDDIELTYSSTIGPYVMCYFALTNISVTQLAKNVRVISVADSIQFITDCLLKRCGYEPDLSVIDDMVIESDFNWITLPNKDKYTLCPVDQPARGYDCEHFECFDLLTFLEYSRQNAYNRSFLQCPFCNKVLKPQNMLIDAFQAKLFTGVVPTKHHDTLQEACRNEQLIDQFISKYKVTNSDKFEVRVSMGDAPVGDRIVELGVEHTAWPSLLVKSIS